MPKVELVLTVDVRRVDIRQKLPLFVDFLMKRRPRQGRIKHELMKIRCVRNRVVDFARQVFGGVVLQPDNGRAEYFDAVLLQLRHELPCVDIAQLRAKSIALTSLFIDLVEATCAPLGITLASPRESARRGSQVALGFAHGYPVMQALIAADVIGDFRPPDILRFGFAPLYISFAETCRAAETLHRILDRELWRQSRFQLRQKVT